ncbi:MAG: hypothetical protein A3J29_22670 [Acidobacteria bacterium RIFCSPLOWO2_12_FULL_67_14b]|nr:MAG: hypothetical protein A3J29_22670 [Acidobacteria bacterium RIFCSPLOWO2_12_FULL_67_14b]
MRTRITLALPVALACVLSLAMAASADQKPKGKAAKPDKGPDVVVVIDRDGHSRIVREFVTREALPPGLAKREALPPGLSKQLRETGSLPPGLEKHLVPVPVTLVARLPPVPVYYNRYFAGRDLIIIDIRSNRIVLLIRDLLP